MTHACMMLVYWFNGRDLLTTSRQKGNPIKAKEKGGRGEGESGPSSVRGHIMNVQEVIHSRLRPQIASSLFLAHNTELVPPYRVLIDTNFINFSLQNKLELISGMMDCLYAKCAFLCVSTMSKRTHSFFPRYTVRHRLCDG